jgi:hypothetical protein
MKVAGRASAFLNRRERASPVRHGKSVAGTKISTVILEQLRASLHQPNPPTALPPLLAALWWEAKGDWNQAHEIAQAENGADAAWVHAYLHRKEGDTTNAAYWYSRAHQPPCTLPFDAEWDQIVSALLTRSTSDSK